MPKHPRPLRLAAHVCDCDYTVERAPRAHALWEAHVRITHGATVPRLCSSSCSGRTPDVEQWRKSRRTVRVEPDVLHDVPSNVPYVEVDQETAYGLTTRMQRSVRVF